MATQEPDARRDAAAVPRRGKPQQFGEAASQEPVPCIDVSAGEAWAMGSGVHRQLLALESAGQGRRAWVVFAGGMSQLGFSEICNLGNASYVLAHVGLFPSGKSFVES